MEITNNAKSPRGFNIKGAKGEDGKDTHDQIVLQPGETVEAEIFDPSNPVYAAWKASGEVEFDGDLGEPRPAPKRGKKQAAEDAPAERVAILDQPLADVERKDV